MCVVFRRDTDVSSKNPAGGVDPRRAAVWARRQGVLSLGHLSLHKQRKVCSRAVGGRKPLTLIAAAAAAGVRTRARARATTRAFTPLRGASYFSLLVQRKDNQKKISSTAEWLVKHTLPTRPPRFALQVHSAAGIFRRDIPVSSKNDAHPCAPPLRGPIRQLRRFGRGPASQKPEQQQQQKSKPKPEPEHPSPTLPLPTAKGGSRAALCVGREQNCILRGEGAELRFAPAKQKRRHRIPLTSIPVNRTPQRHSAFQPVKTLIRTSTTS